MKKINQNNKGFTLVEMLVAVSLFVVVTTISIGAILTIFDANKKAQSSKTVVDNLNLAIENMARMVRFGNYYYCGISTNDTESKDCSPGGDSISVTFEGSRIIYKLSSDGKAIQKKEGSGDYEAITSPETTIQYLKFYVFYSDSGDTNQPYVIAVIRGYSGSRPSNQTNFSIQTMMSQRKLDL